MRQAHKEQLAAKGLPPLSPLPTVPGYPRWKQDFVETQYRMERTRDEMQDYFDRRTEQWQESERGELMEQRIQILEEVIEKLESLQEEVR
jgi:hypothetical protein